MERIKSQFQRILHYLVKIEFLTIFNIENLAFNEIYESFTKYLSKIYTRPLF